MAMSSTRSSPDHPAPSVSANTHITRTRRLANLLAWLGSVLLLTTTLALPSPATPSHPRPAPNFLIVLADDLGYSDLGCYGGEIQTPNLDGLAHQGLRFTQFYNTARCWPTRGALLTGYYAQAIRRDQLPNQPGGGQGSRPPWARLLPQLLTPAGYRAYHSGKWHVDGPRLAGGFHRSYSLEDHDRYFHPRSHFEDDRPLPPVNPDSPYYASTAIANHAIDCLADHAARFPHQPFFQFVAFTAPHFPLQAPAQDIARYQDRYLAGWDRIREERWDRLRQLNLVRGRNRTRTRLPAPEPSTVPAWNLPPATLTSNIGPGEVATAVPWNSLSPEQRRFQAAKMAVHAAMVDRLDQEVGRILAQLRRMNAWDNTIIVFLSDNGASAEQIIRGDRHAPGAAPGSAASYLGLGPGWSTTANTPFRKHKSWVHEGGIATPFIVHWPNGIPPAQRGKLRHTPGHVVDLAPTLLDWAALPWPSTLQPNTPVPPPHGRSLAAALQKDLPPPTTPLWWLHDGHRAVRIGDWKLVSSRSGPDPGTWELYNLRRDRTETRNLAASHPDLVHRLARAWESRAAEFQALAAPPARPQP